MLNHGRLPRNEQSNSPKATTTAMTRAQTLVSTLTAKDDKLPVVVLKEMVSLLGFKLVEK
jgi:hypothetical protein